MQNECWGAVAAELARLRGETVVAYYGISLREFRELIKGNKLTPAVMRNRVMGFRTLRFAVEV
jgi:hypothetical protein